MYLQADFTVRNLPLLLHDGKDELYWARTALMPCGGMNFAS